MYKEEIPYRLEWHLFSLIFVILVAYESAMLLAYDSADFNHVYLVAIWTVGLSVAFLLISYYLSCAIRPQLWPYFISFFISFSILELKLIYFDKIFQLPDYAFFLYLVFAPLLILTFTIGVKIVTRPTITLYLVCFLILVVVPTFAAKIEKGGFSIQIDSYTGIEESELHDRLSKIQFIDKPNVYVLLYDSLISSSLASQLLGIENLSYQDALDKHFVNLIPTVSPNVPTKPSINGIMRLDQLKPVRFDLFPGRSPSALGTLFAANGYEITTGFTSYFWGKRGSFVDRHISLEEIPLEKSTQCLGLGTSFFHKSRAFGVCQVFGEYSNPINMIVDTIPHLKLNEKYEKKQWHQIIFDEIHSAGIVDNPQLKIFYTYTPIGHTGGNYKHDDPVLRNQYQEEFKKKSKWVLNIINELVKSVNENDPKSIVILAGDHGTWVSRAETETNDFYLKDRHMVYGGVMKTEHRCASMEHISSLSTGYFTPARIIAAIGNCLTANNELASFLSFEENAVLIDFINSGRAGKIHDFSKGTTLDGIADNP